MLKRVWILLLLPCVLAIPGQIIVNPGNPAWLSYEGGGNFFMCGPGDPEGFLYRGTRLSDGTRNGDQMALIDKLKPTGANSIYMQIIRSHGGDGGATENPFIDSDISKGIDADILNQWEEWFTEMDNAGIVIFLIFYDDAINVGSFWPMQGSELHSKERGFIETIVNRFEHHKNLIWVVMEEVEEMGSDYQLHASKIAQTIRQADNNEHVIAVHQLSGLTFHFPNDQNIDQFAIQYNQDSASALHNGIVTAWNNANGRYNLNMAEAAGYGTGTTARQKNWASAMGGAYVMVYEMDIAGTSASDLLDCGRLVDFMETTNFHEMEPHDELAFSDTQYVLAKPYDSYIAYSSNANSIGIKDMSSGTYRFKWMDTIDGSMVTETKDVQSGDQSWAVPGGPEVAVYIEKISQPTVFPGASWQTRTPEELGLDKAKLDQFANNVGGVGCIVKDGYMVKTWGSQSSKADWASAGKPVVSTLLMFSVKEGRLSGFDDKVYDWDWNLNTKDRSMTFTHLANMESGYARGEAPGSAWAYNDYAIKLYGLTMQKVLGTDLDSALRSRLGALKFEDGSIFSSRSGLGVYTSPRDFARIGWFWLNKGNWNGQQHLPEQYFNNYMRPQVSSNLPRTSQSGSDYLGIGTFGGDSDQTPYGPGIYGFNWWFNEPVGEYMTWPDAPTDTFQANGHWNQEVMTIIPSLNMVVAARGNWGTFSPGSTSGMNQNLKLLVDANPQALICGDGLCNVGETCVKDSCCDGNIYGSGQVCCSGNIQNSCISMISNLIVSSGQPYEIINYGLQIRQLIYIDRTFAFTSIPKDLQGSTYIKTANSDKNLQTSNFLSFYVNDDVTVYVAYDDRISPKPLWLGPFTDSGNNLATDDVTLSIYKKSYPRGNIVLGGNEGGSFSMYSVIVVPATCSSADINSDAEVDLTELAIYISDWKVGNITINELMSGMNDWKFGC